MRKTYVYGKKYHRLIPCPDYDFSSMEQWLSDLGEEGLFLTQDGIFGDIATFECKDSQKVKYRLEAVQQNTGVWAENGGDPDQEQIALSRKYAWEYIARRKDFYIYRCADPDARELNTDPEVQALALNAVKKRRRGVLLSTLFFVFVYPVVLTRGCLLLSAISMGTWWMILAMGLALLMIADDLQAFTHLKKIQNALLREGEYKHVSDWKKETIPYFIRGLVKTVLILFLFLTILRSWGMSITDERKIPLDAYGGTIPFATIKDIAGDGYSDYFATMTGMNMGFDTIEEKKDWLAPRCVEYNEHAQVRRADGQKIDGGLYIDYCELRNPALAKILVQELYRLDRLKKRFDPLETPELQADFAAAYRDDLHFPTVLIRKGSTVVRARFYQSSSYETIPVEEWAQIISDSVN